MFSNGNTNENNVQQETQSKSFFHRLKEGLNKTSKDFTGKLDSLLTGYGKIDEELFEELEELLIMADVGYNATIMAMQNLQEKVKEHRAENATEVKELLKEVLIELLTVEKNGSPAKFKSRPNSHSSSRRQRCRQDYYYR